MKKGKNRNLLILATPFFLRSNVQDTETINLSLQGTRYSIQGRMSRSRVKKMIRRGSIADCGFGIAE